MKKNSFFLKLIAVLLLLAVAPPLLAQGGLNRILYQAKYNGTPVFGTDTLGGVTYTTISYGDLMNSGSPGMPSLPIDYIRFSVPYNATNFTVTATKLMNQPHNLDHLMYPCQAPRMMNDTTPVVITLPDTAAYYSGVSYPSAAAWVVDEGFLDGENHIVTVAVMPFSYGHTATSDVIGQWKRVSVMLRYSLSDSLAMYPIVRNDSLLREEGYQLTRSMVVNPNQVKSFAPDASQVIWGMDSMGINPNGLGGDGLNGLNPPIPIPDTTDINTTVIPINNYPYLIVTTSDLYQSMRRIAALKRQKGYNVKVVTMDDVMHAPFAQSGDRFRRADSSYVAFPDSAGVLRQYLKWYYKFFGTKYVLLAGNGVPYRSINKRIGRETLNGHGDLYFSDLTANWEETIDRIPELYVGRLLVDNCDKIENYTEKLFRYELNPGKGDYNYLRTGLFTEADEFHLNGFIHGLTDFKNRISPILTNQISMIEDLENHYPKGNDVLDSITVKHPAFMCSFNHGDPSYIMTCGNKTSSTKYFLLANDQEPGLPNYLINTENGNGLNRMQNKNYPMIYYSLSCQTMPFNVVSGFEIDMNYGQSFTMGKDYGGPVYMGNTRSVTDLPIKKLSDKFVNKIVSGYFILGEADALSKMDYSEQDFCTGLAIYHNYLGDPLLRIWTDIPTEYECITVNRSDNAISIAGITSTQSSVVLCDNNGKVISIKNDSPSVTFNNVSPNSSIMIYNHNMIPYLPPLLLQNVFINETQYVIARDMVAGNHIDTDQRTPGDVIVKSGVEYEIEASGTVRLEDGFMVEKGATFAIYPSCF